MELSGARTSQERPPISERLWDASREEFSQLGYHGARVQNIARRAGCNVALLYRHWPSKRGLYVDILRSLWIDLNRDVLRGIGQGAAGPSAVVNAQVEAIMAQPIAARILIRELLDGNPFLSQLLAAEPQLIDPVRSAARALAADGSGELRAGVDPTVAVLTVGGIAALIASAHEATAALLEAPIPPESWRRHLRDVMLHGLLPCPH